MFVIQLFWKKIMTEQLLAPILYGFKVQSKMKRIDYAIPVIYWKHAKTNIKDNCAWCGFIESKT